MSHEHTFTDSDRAMLSARVDQFHHDLGKGSISDWEPYLLRLPRTLRKRVLVELSVVHLAHEWKVGRMPEVESYLRQFPELGPEAPETLVLEEYRCRLQAKQPAEVDQFTRRFPSLFPALLDKLRDVELEVARGPQFEAERHGIPLRGYEKITWLGGGAFADVWLARNANGQEKALKIVRERMTSEAAQRELKALQQVKNIRHRCVLTTEDYWIENGQLHVVSQLAEGSLKGRMEECQQEEGLPGIPVSELFTYICDAASGLDYLHEQGITHRDVKPDNILLVNGGAVLADFGLARRQVSLMTQQSVFAGTMPYMAPELFGGEGGPPSDQYALALSYIHLRQGRHPLKMLPFPQIMSQHLCGEYDMDMDISPAERAVLLRALDQVPTQRYSSCQDFVRELANALGLPYHDRRKRSSATHLPVRQVPSSPSAGTVESFVPLQSLAHPGTESAPRTGAAQIQTDVQRVTLSSKPIVSATAPAGRSRPSQLIPFLVLSVLIFTLGVLLTLVLVGGKSEVAEQQPDTPSPGEVDPAGVTKDVPGPTPGVSTGAISPNPDTPETPVKVEPAKVLFPPGTRVDGSEVEDTPVGKYARWVTVDYQGQVVRFRFIPAAESRSGKPIGPLYCQESKVWNRLYASGTGLDATAPALGMSRADAEAFAAKVVSKGRLPTPEEWDAATGFYAQPRPVTLTKSGGKAIVDVARPSALRKGSITADVGHYDLLDLAGNGCEWTSGTLDNKELGITRGRNFLFEGPLTFAILEQEQKEPKSAYINQGNRYTGFRIVITAPTPTSR